MIIKCVCGNISMIVDKDLDCDQCEKNGFFITDEISEKLGVESGYAYEEKLLQEIINIGECATREQCATEGECLVGINQNNGCNLYTCTKCNKTVDNIYIVGYC